ncbi:hypothetical protein AVEN_44714-1 [Araneus ventricosus]|uniref:Uncharacterized protein n=1 Tax=Araneus ventricosus TaxID=182803 RepID=A0A4Y2P8G0_ARAVE|nr:hypothetical protein AVEN_44714-1 [Araneus ventricosus]
MILAISNYVREFKDYILLTDSMSNITALKNLNFKSPKCSLFLAKIIAEALKKCKTLELVYSPAHVGIRENEWADSVARDARVSPRMDLMHVTSHPPTRDLREAAIGQS